MKKKIDSLFENGLFNIREQNNWWEHGGFIEAVREEINKQHLVK